MKGRRELDTWDELVKKTIDADAKARFQPPSFTCEMDQRCPRGNCPVHTIVAKSPAQGSLTWDPREESSETLRIRSPYIPCTHTPRAHILRDPRMARPLTRKHERRNRGVNASSTSGLGRTLDPPQPPASTFPAPPTSPPVGPVKTRAKKPASTVTRRDIMRETALNSGRTVTPQQSSNSLGNLHVGD